MSKKLRFKLITGPLYLCFRSPVTKRKNLTWDSSMALLSPTCFIRWSRHIFEFDFNATNFVHKRTYKMKIYGIFGCKFLITILTTNFSFDHHLFFTGLPLFCFSFRKNSDIQKKNFFLAQKFTELEQLKLTNSIQLKQD